MPIEYDKVANVSGQDFVLATVVNGVTRYYAGPAKRRVPRLLKDKKLAKKMKYGRCFGMSKYMRSHEWEIVPAHGHE